MYGLIHVCLDKCNVSNWSVNRTRDFRFRGTYAHYTRDILLLLLVLCPLYENRQPRRFPLFVLL